MANSTTKVPQGTDYTLSYVDYVIFVITLLSSSLISIYFGCFKTERATVFKYLTGERRMKSFPVAASLVACLVSSITLLALPADVYRYGASYLLTPLSMVLVVLAQIYVYLPVFYNLKLTSVYEYLEKRFDRKTRLLGSFLYITEATLVVPLVLYLPVLTMSTVFGVNIHLTLFVVCAICILYTSVGGLRSVVWIDLFQLSVMLATLLLILIMGTIIVGGLPVVWDTAISTERLDIFDFELDPTKRDSFWITVIGTAAMWLSESCNQSAVQKFSAVSTFKESILTVIMFGIGLSFLKVVSTINGLVVYAHYHGCDPLSTGEVTKNDALVPHFVMHLVENIPGLPGLFISGIFCASLSTFSTELNSISAVIYKDFVSFLLPETSDKVTLTIVKVIVVVSGSVLTLLVLLVDKLGGIFQLLISLVGVAGGALLGIFSLGVLIPRANSKGAFYGGLTGMLFVTCILVPAKYYEVQEIRSHPTKFLTTTECYPNISTSRFEIIQSPSKNATTVSESHFLFRISHYYYTLIGTVVTMFSGTVLSYITSEKTVSVDKSLITPLCHFLLKSKPNVDQELCEETDVILKHS